MGTIFTVGYQESGYDYRDQPEESFQVEVLRLGQPAHPPSQVEVHFRFTEGDKPRTGKMVLPPDVARWLALALTNATEGAAEILSSEATVREGVIVSRGVSTAAAAT